MPTMLRPFRAVALATILASTVLVAAPAHATQAEPVKPTLPPASGAATTPATQAPAAPVKDKVSYVRFLTSMGPILIELDETNAPVSAANFAEYAKSGFYDGTCFHRIIPGFVVQGGGFTTDMVQKQTRAPISNEWQNGLKNRRGTLSMARLGGRADSATSQFFMNLVDNGMLDTPRDGAGYAVFGEIVEGMDVVDAMAKAPTGMSKGMRDVPKQAIVLEKAEWFATRPAPMPPAAKDSAEGAAPAGSAAAKPSLPATPADPATKPADPSKPN
jgi:cyclophilin family peptidyl-prolyl cis-trans isomerase